MKKIIALVLAALMMFTLVAPASAAEEIKIPDEVVEKVVQILPAEITEKINVFTVITSAIKDFVHKVVGTITQTFGSSCPFCDNGTHLAGTPSAKVTVLDEEPVVVVDGLEYTLDIAYNFEPSELTAKTEDFSNWHADFVITTSKDVKNLLLAGQYDEWSKDYVGLFIDEIKAGEELRLIETYGKEMAGKDITVNCYEIYTKIKSFNCGLYNNDPANAGATITVELRLYETYPAEETGALNSTNVETGRSVTIATVPCTISAIAA